MEVDCVVLKKSEFEEAYDVSSWDFRFEVWNARLQGVRKHVEEFI